MSVRQKLWDVVEEVAQLHMGVRSHKSLMRAVEILRAALLRNLKAAAQL